MTLVQLEYIVALDTYRNFLLAAEKCFVTQPTLSVQIQKLEDSLGVKLFDRSKQPVIPTEIGIEIIEQARNVLNESYKLKEVVSDRKGEIKGELKIGVIPTIAPYLLPKVILSFVDKFPQVQLMIWEYTTERIIQDLKNGTLDCGLLSTPLEDNSLKEIPLFYENFVAYASKSSGLLNKKIISSKDISTDELWLLNEGHCMRNQVLNICNRKKTSKTMKNFEYYTGSIETLKRMVDLNSGVTILPELALADFSAEQMERIRHFRSPEPSREVSIVLHRNFLKRNLINTLQNEIMEIVPKHLRSKKKKEIMEIYS
jgi:LysR family transcriptional regulator, hydrogen peroxide-inducible genes activator